MKPQNKRALPEQFERAKWFINKHRSFIMASHARTDGDDLGSMLAIKSILDAWHKPNLPIALGGVPATLQFLPNQHAVVEDVASADYDAIILFGCCDPTRTGVEKIITSPKPILNIDHHPDNTEYGEANLVDADKSSVAELVYNFIKYLDMPITSDISKCLLTGMFTDTGSFMHANTKASTFAAAAELMKHGARIDKINSFTLQNKELNDLHAWGKALENTRLDLQNHFAMSVLTSEDLKGIGKLNANTFEGFADMLNTIPEARFAIFMWQDGDYIKGSIRSDEIKKTNVFNIAKLFGGGGHKLASGFKIKARLIKNAAGSWSIEY